VRFETSPAPQLAPPITVALTMRRVLYALIPATLVYTWYFGWGLLINMTLAAGIALACEAAMLRLRKKPQKPFLLDFSAVVTAVLFAFTLPPLTPWWITAIGISFAIVFAKHLYGGLGYNPFNPAMAGYVVLLISFPVEMTTWIAPNVPELDLPRLGLLETLAVVASGQLPAGLTWDAVTMATPLDDVKVQLAQMQTMAEIQSQAIYGDFGGKGWEWVSNWIGLGGLWLLYKGVIRWHIPLSMLASLFIVSLFIYLLDPGSHASPVFHLFTGATVLGAFFIATDPVSAATSVKGRLIYGAGIGILTFVIRNWSDYPDGVAFAVLLMNMAVPAIDYFTKPRVFGHSNRSA